MKNKHEKYDMLAFVDESIEVADYGLKNDVRSGSAKAVELLDRCFAMIELGMPGCQSLDLNDSYESLIIGRYLLYFTQNYGAIVIVNKEITNRFDSGHWIVVVE